MVGLNGGENPAANFLEGFKLTAHRWFPVDPQVLERVSERAFSKHYNQHPQDLIDDIRSDASLYLYCVRKLKRIINSNQSAQDAAQLRDSINQILLELKSKQSNHEPNHSQPFQVERQREIVLSSTVVDLLGEKLHIDRDAGFTCALLRQLGYALIAWNYPTIYRHALEEIGAQGTSGRTDLNTILHATLGFSPAMLGLRFAEVWQLPSEITHEISPHNLYEPNTHQARGSISMLCEVGEAFARANNPHHYPNPRHDWDMAMEVLNHHLGASGLEKIKTRAEAIYGTTAKLVLPADRLKQPQAGAKASYGAQRYENNLFINPLPDALQTRIKSLYDRIHSERVESDLIRELLQEIAESLGFSAAVVYTLDPAEAMLNPVFRKGMPRFTTLRSVGTGMRLNETEPVRRAFCTDLVICEEGSRMGDERRLLLALPIRGRTRIGVLYLEQTEHKPEGTEIDPLLGGKFILTCLKDLLLIK